MKPVLMIHEMREEFFDLPLHEYILTFDDGLYSQYYYLDKLKDIDTEKIFFISTGIVADEDTHQSMEFPICSEAHDKFFNDGNTEDYMNWDQIRELDAAESCTIGGHGHSHVRHMPMLSQFRDTKTMCMTFSNELGYVPTKFCYPYNDEDGKLCHILSNGFEFTEFYGSEREDIYDTINARSAIR